MKKIMTYKQFIKDEEFKSALERIGEMMESKMQNIKIDNIPISSGEIIVDMKIRPLRSIKYIDFNFEVLPTGTISDGFGG